MSAELASERAKHRENLDGLINQTIKLHGKAENATTASAELLLLVIALREELERLTEEHSTLRRLAADVMSLATAASVDDCLARIDAAIGGAVVDK